MTTKQQDAVDDARATRPKLQRAAPTSEPTAEQVMEILQRRFPREWEIAVLQAANNNMARMLSEASGAAKETDDE